MKRESKKTDSEHPGRSILGELNDVHDKLRKIQCATCFLGTATTDLENNYSDDLVFGAKICFDLLDTQFEQLIGHIESIATEVK